MTHSDSLHHDPLSKYIFFSTQKKQNKQNHYIYWTQIIPNKHFKHFKYLLCTTILASESDGNTRNFASLRVSFQALRLHVIMDAGTLFTDKLFRDD